MIENFTRKIAATVAVMLCMVGNEFLLVTMELHTHQSYQLFFEIENARQPLRYHIL